MHLPNIISKILYVYLENISPSLVEYEPFIGVSVIRATAVIGVRFGFVFSLLHCHVFLSQSQSLEWPRKCKIASIDAVSEETIVCVNDGVQS